MGKWISRKFVKNHKFSCLANYSAKLKCTDIDYTRAMQRHIQELVKYLRWSVLWKQIAAFSGRGKKYQHLAFLML